MSVSSRLLASAALVLSAVVAGCAGQSADDVSAGKGAQLQPGGAFEVHFEQLAEGVWMHTSFKDVPPWGPFPTNGLIIEATETETVLIDTAWNDGQTLEILNWSQSVLGRSITSAVLTHAHDDKMGGVGVLRGTGIATYAHPASNELAPARGLVAAEFDLEFDAGGSVRGAQALLPGLEIFYPGPGHTIDNLVVYAEGARVLFGGCLIRPGRSFSLGNTADAVVGNWAQATENVRRRFPDPAIVVPSHGPPAGIELVTHTIEVAAAATVSVPE